MTLSARPEARAHAPRALGGLPRPARDGHAGGDRPRRARRSRSSALGLSLAVASWPALAPFVAGAVIAYAVLPLANRLDRFMPRVLAALLAELVAVAILGSGCVAVVPPLVTGYPAVAGRAADAEARSRPSLADFEAQLGQLQEPLRGIVLAVATEAAANLQATIDGAGRKVPARSSPNQILGIAGTLSFLLGLLVIPAWVLTLVADERAIKATRGQPDRAGDPAATSSALGRIVDRAFGTFLRIRVLLALVVGLPDLDRAERRRRPGHRRVPLRRSRPSVLLGGLQLIPELGLLPRLLPDPARAGDRRPDPRADRRSSSTSSRAGSAATSSRRACRAASSTCIRALLIPAIVVLSQFGGLWLFAAAPVVAILRDITRYLAGRLGDPPKPANVLPGERAPIDGASTERRRVPVGLPARPAAADQSRLAATASPAPRPMAPVTERSAAT